MNPVTRVFIILLLTLSIISCVSVNSTLGEKINFPLSELWTHKFSDNILNIASSPNFVVVSRIGRLSALDAKSGMLLWDKNIDFDPDSLPVFLGENIIVTDLSRIITLDKFGNEINSFAINTPDQDAELLAVYSRYAFLRRVPSYVLEVYNLEEEGIAWEVAIGRGTVNIGFIENIDAVVIASSTFVSAQNISNGQNLWRLDDTAQVMVTDQTRAYYFPRVLIGDNGVNVSAVDVDSGNLVWDGNDTVYSELTPYSMQVFNETLVLSTDHGLIAKNINDGKEIWRFMTDEIFYAQPVMINGILYARGAYTHTMYAISPITGNQLGYLNIDQVGTAVLTHVESENLFAIGEMLVFTSQSSIYVYK